MTELTEPIPERPAVSVTTAVAGPLPPLAATPGGRAGGPAVARPDADGFPEGYVRCGEVGRGGMGVVYRATEIELGRDVAVKLLLDRFPTGGAMAARFLEEARIAATLQHPSIPAVHKIGVLPNGRPFMVMKLVKGANGERPHTFADLLQERKSLDQDRLRFIHVFWQVCQAVGYAHERNVIHRDLKPSNVMVGAFGEVQVMDWGLGKVLPDAGGAGEAADQLTRIPSPRDPAAPPTEHGLIQGTPAYMSPEQALGEVEAIGPRSDVFGLGAILCVILTGFPPYQGELALPHAAAWKVDKAFTRLDQCGADVELIDLAKHCLARDPGGRPASAALVARAVSEWRVAADERARTAAIGEQTRKVGTLALRACEAMVAEVPSRLADTAARELVMRCAEDTLTELVAELRRSAVPCPELLRAHSLLGTVAMGLGRYEDALREYQAGNALARQLADAAALKWAAGLTAPTAGTAPAQQLADAAPGVREAQLSLGQSYIPLGDAALKLGRTNEARGFYDRAREWAEHLHRGDPGRGDAGPELARALERLGDAALPIDGPDEAWRLYADAHEVRMSLADRHPGDDRVFRELVMGLSRWAEFARRVGRCELARDWFEQIDAVLNRILVLETLASPVRRAVVSCLMYLGELAEWAGELSLTETCYERAILLVKRFTLDGLLMEEAKLLEERLRRCRLDPAATVETPALRRNTPY